MIDPDAMLSALMRSQEYDGQLVYRHVLPAVSASPKLLEPSFPEVLSHAFERLGITELWTHQREAIDLLRSGYNTVITTPTASGKSLCYNGAVYEHLLANRDARALYLFPTKALAYDQAQKMSQLDLFGRVAHATYDGDTHKDERSAIRRAARIVLTNPDMLHVSILHNHAMWSHFFRNLAYIVVDEAHAYRGIFGTHVSSIFRRLSRWCRHYGATPQWVVTSATVGNPVEFVGNLTQQKVIHVNGGDAPRGRRVFAMWNPPVTKGDTPRRRGAGGEAAFLAAALVKRDARTIVFTRARRSTELVYKNWVSMLSATMSGEELVDRITPYRAGYTKEQRREIEERLFSGELLGVVATSALELGVDIGSLDAAVIAGYPGTIASTWQQSGRAGRRETESLTILVASDNPLDQFLMRNPTYLFETGVENAVINPNNPHVVGAHICCAADEGLLDHQQVLAMYGERASYAISLLEKSGVLRFDGSYYRYIGPSRACDQFSIRSADGTTYSVTTPDGTMIGSLEGHRVNEEAFVGAYYYHQGIAFEVTGLDRTKKVVMVSRANRDYITNARSTGSIDVIETIGSKEVGETIVYFGLVKVKRQVTGYEKRGLGTDDPPEVITMDMPETEFITTAVWYPVTPETERYLGLHGADLPGTVHAAEHAAIGLLPLFALCDRNDIGGVSTAYHPHVGGPAVFVHDAVPMGVGIAEAGFRVAKEWLNATASLISGCKCESGCPACIQSPKCGNNNTPLDKAGATMLLKLQF
ncbi:MAG: DEAD/DEAH box helicase [Armatimonadota bacterium]